MGLLSRYRKYGPYQVQEVRRKRYQIYKNGSPIGPVYSSPLAAETDACNMYAEDMKNR